MKNNKIISRTERIADRPVIAKTDTASTTRPTAHAASIVQRTDNLGVVEAAFAHTRHTHIKYILYRLPKTYEKYGHRRWKKSSLVIPSHL